MQKKLILVLCVILVGLSFSCSEYILPKRVKVTGTVDLPVRVGVIDFSDDLKKIFTDAFHGDEEAGEDKIGDVFPVTYNRQTVQTFCIHIPVEITEDLNPNAFLKTINKQIDSSFPSEPGKIGPIVMPRGQIDISDIESGLPDIQPIKLDSDSLGKHVIQIDFNKCEGTVKSGIGLNFYLDKVVDGLEMAIECNDDDLNFSGAYQLLKEKKDNIFGNEDDAHLKLVAKDGDPSYQNGLKKLRFTMHLRSAGPDKNKLDTNAVGFTPGDPVTIMEGRVEFFQNWTKAEINMGAAMKGKYDPDEGICNESFPNTTGGAEGGFDLSALGEYLDGGFTFSDLETKMYMDNPVSFDMEMELDTVYTGKKEFEEDGTPVKKLYKGAFSVDKNPFVLRDHLKDGNYTSQHLPGIIDEKYNDNAIVDVFEKMPASLNFEYIIRLTDEILIISPDMFDNTDDQSTINMSLMIMLPLRLVATDNDSVVRFPKLFEESTDLFGRDKVYKNSLFESINVDRITMTINFLNPIFSGGHLYIDGYKNIDPVLFPNGVKLSGKSLIVDFSDKQIETIQSTLIKPNLWIKLNKGNTVTVPKKMGYTDIKFEMKGSVITEDLLE